MKTAVICVGKLREAHFQAAAAEYAKRLGRFGRMEIIELPDKPEPKNASPADIRLLVAQEGERILSHIGPRDAVIALCIEGTQMASPAFARRLAALEGAGTDRAVFVIGGSNGLSDAVVRRAAVRLSFSPMTFPHQLARVMLLEQIYRARKILAGETYHK